jgi:transcription factor TFIIIB component B''
VARGIGTNSAKPWLENTTGKKFAPKAARRRPGAAPAAPTPAATPSAPATPAPAAEPQTSQVEPETEPASSTTAQLPTPDATQEPITEPTPQAVAAATSAAPGPTPTPTEPLPPPVPTNLESQTQAVAHATADRGLTTQYLEDGVEVGRSPKRRRIEPPAGPSGAAAIASQPVQQEKEAGPQQPEAEAAAVPATEGTEQVAEAGADNQALPQPRKRRKLPWVAVNHPQDGEEETVEETVAAAPTRKPRQPPKPRGKKKAIADADADHVEEEEEEGDEDEPQPTRKRPSAKARGKRKATEPTQDGEEAPALPKRTRKPRKALSQAIVEGTEDEVGRIADEIVAAAVRGKPRKRKSRATPDGEEVDGVEGEEGTREKKKRGRPAREATPSDAEDEIIDPDVTYMDALAARDFRKGKKSDLEMQMRTVDWEAVKQRRREEDSRTIHSKAEQEAADRILAEQGAELAAQAGAGPQMRLNEATNQLEIVPESGTIDREGDADREIAAMEVTEDRDITNRLTTRSFMKNNKRFPNDFLLPGQGRRWTDPLTKLFYNGLRSFGTDFQMISQMFPGFTRRSIKTKFTREERDNPEGVKEALRCQCELNGVGWTTFLKETKKTEESFADVDEIKRQMAERDAEMRVQIEAAKLEAEERRRQRELAGVDADGNPIEESGNKENGKGKKTRKKKEKVRFEEQPDVEIIEDNDPDWGNE